MAAMTVVADGMLRKYYQVSGSNSADVMTIPCAGSRMRLLTARLVFKTQSAPAGVDTFVVASSTKTCPITLDSGKGSAFDTLLNTITCVAGYGVWAPASVETFEGDDAIVLTPEASGTVSVVSCLEVTVLVDEIV